MDSLALSRSPLFYSTQTHMKKSNLVSLVVLLFSRNGCAQTNSWPPNNPWSSLPVNPWSSNEPQTSIPDSRSIPESTAPQVSSEVQVAGILDENVPESCLDTCQRENQEMYQCNFLTLISQFNICRCNQYATQL